MRTMSGDMLARGESPERQANRAPVPRSKGDLARAFKDPVDLGVCTDEEGRRLVELYVTTWSHIDVMLTCYSDIVL